MPGRRVEVVVWSSVKKPLTYEVPESSADEELLGRRVLAPVGGRSQVGLIVGFDNSYEGPVKQIGGFCDTEPVMTARELDICRFISEYYFASLAEAVKAWLPGAMTRKLVEKVRLDNPQELARLVETGNFEAKQVQELFGRLSEIRAAKLSQVTRSAIRDLHDEGVLSRHWSIPRTKAIPIDYLVSLTGAGDERRLGEKGRAVLAYVREHGEIRLSILKATLDMATGTMKSLEERGLILLTEPPPFETIEVKRPAKEVKLTEAQQNALDRISPALEKKRFAPFLLHGVTGSGKTEVYLRAAQQVVAADRGVIIIVPEIGLAQAMYHRLHTTFGNQLALLHSRLTQRSRLELWQEIKEGSRRIVLGPRSAIFAPMLDLGMIVVDEEHDQSFKQESPAPRYQARDVALYRARLENCAVVLGSATPALESYHNALTGKYELLRLPERVDRRAMPKVRVVDLVKARDAGRFSFLSDELVAAMQESLGTGGQVMLLLNRRGFSPSVHCHSCGMRFECKHCAVTLVYHKRDNALLCHSCGYRQPYPRTCPECGGGLFLFRGIGTEKLVEEVQARFPETEIARMDLDTTRRKGEFDRVFDAFRDGQARILVGTQMIAKGFDFPDVALMGIVSADTALELPDFRARERTFQLLTQAAGRAGRHTFSGKVVLQTFHPEDPTIALAVEHDYERFYETEIADREALGFAPFRHIILVGFEGSDQQAVARASDWFAAGLNSIQAKQFRLLGPVAAPISRRRGRWRYQVLLKTNMVKATLQALRQISEHKSLPGRSKLSIIVDVDPVAML